MRSRSLKIIGVTQLTGDLRVKCIIIIIKLGELSF